MTQTDITALITRLQELQEQATPLPWKCATDWYFDPEDKPVKVGYACGPEKRDTKMAAVFLHIENDRQYMEAAANAVPALCDEVERLQARIAELEAANRWVPVGERMPKTKQRVDVVFTGTPSGKQHITQADYIAPHTVQADDYLSDECELDFADYDDEADMYWTPAGWYEYQYEADMNYFMTGKVTHWRPLPEPPKDTQS